MFFRPLIKSLTEPYRYPARYFSRAVSGRAANLDDIEAFILANPVVMRAPMILISQVQRSGGTLLAQLFDSHPQVAAYPDELRFGEIGDAWPPLTGELDAERTFRALFDPKVVRMMSKGFAKGARDPMRQPFFLVPRLQYASFMHLCRSHAPSNSRAMFDAFFTSYFNAWLNYRSDLAAKQRITAFAPRLAEDEANIDLFFANYPDGRLVQIIRDPRTWYPSAKNHRTTFFKGKTPKEILEKWQRSSQSILRNKARYGDRVIIIRFEDLVGNTERTMRSLAGEFEIAWDPILLSPTFNGKPVRANSSFDVASTGLIAGPLKREAVIPAQERKLIDEPCLWLYERVAEEALPLTRKPASAAHPS
jgi:Sulfotransferase family